MLLGSRFWPLRLMLQDGSLLDFPENATKGPFIAKFTVQINGTLTSFFHRSRGLRQGYPLSPYLFVLAMETLSLLLKRAKEGGFILGFKVGGKGGKGVKVSHFPFVDDTLVFCEACKDQLLHLHWTLMQLEAILGLKTHLEKSELILVGRVPIMEELVEILGCRVGSLPSRYLGLCLGVVFKSTIS